MIYEMYTYIYCHIGIENDCIFTTQCIYVFHIIVTINHFFHHAKLTERSLKFCRCVYSVRCNLHESQSSKFFLRLPPVIIKL